MAEKPMIGTSNIFSLENTPSVSALNFLLKERRPTTGLVYETGDTWYPTWAISWGFLALAGPKPKVLLSSMRGDPGGRPDGV
ncbi:hypothetical protein VM1G_11961 [Cytospora mali]|uniref:Uncharacterized protein n=1 Tax=Cytospora mali TaxID=578113 RepID=A0A194WCD3_CYTMA|nr:hypothetical protein VM1G_11961 [Valsa mali]